MKFFITQD